MSFPLVLRRIARKEYDRIFDWYEDQRPGLGEKFAEKVEATFSRISETPELQATVYRDVRKARLQTFPYSVIYRIRDGKVVVMGIIHDKRDPRFWQGRA